MVGERGMVEIIGLCGYYTMVSMTLNTFEFDLPDGRSMIRSCVDAKLRLHEDRWQYLNGNPAQCIAVQPVLHRQANGETMPETHPSSRARGSGMFISRSPISIARSDFIAACWLRADAAHGSGAAFISAGGYHHHIGLNTWESKGGHPPPPGTTGLFHTAILYPTRPALADALYRVIEAGIPLDGASDHGVSEALYLRDPDENGVELYWDRPEGAMAAQGRRRAGDVHAPARSGGSVAAAGGVTMNRRSRVRIMMIAAAATQAACSHRTAARSFPTYRATGRSRRGRRRR